jgi:hypothetical protein
LTKYSVFNVPRRKVRSERKSIWTGADDRNGAATQEAAFPTPWGMMGAVRRGIDRKKRGNAFRPR